MDQQGKIVIAGENHTWSERGARQVNVNAKDEKRAYTICVSSTPAGDILPPQLVWSGSSWNSLPDKTGSLASNMALQMTQLGSRRGLRCLVNSVMAST